MVTYHGTPCVSQEGKGVNGDIPRHPSEVLRRGRVNGDIPRHPSEVLRRGRVNGDIPQTPCGSQEGKG